MANHQETFASPSRRRGKAIICNASNWEAQREGTTRERHRRLPTVSRGNAPKNEGRPVWSKKSTKAKKQAGPGKQNKPSQRGPEAAAPNTRHRSLNLDGLQGRKPQAKARWERWKKAPAGPGAQWGGGCKGNTLPLPKSKS